MILIPIFALLIGIAIPMLLHTGPITGVSGVYLAIAGLAGLDSVCGGIRAGLEGKFHNDVFVTGFLANVLIAFSFAWLGDRIGIDLFMAAVLVMGWRIYTNLSLIRRFMLTMWKDAQEKLKLREKHARQQQPQKNA